jgi:hypothetical protein
MKRINFMGSMLPFSHCRFFSLIKERRYVPVVLETEGRAREEGKLSGVWIPPHLQCSTPPILQQ